VFSQPGYKRAAARVTPRLGFAWVLRGKGRLIGEVPGPKYTRRDA